MATGLIQVYQNQLSYDPDDESKIWCQSRILNQLSPQDQLQE